MALLADDFDIARMTHPHPHPFSLEDAEGFIARMARRDGNREAVFAIETAEEGLLGVVGLHPGPAGTEIGYWLGRPFWGRGFATEAVAAVLGWASADWGRRFVASGHFADNLASGRSPGQGRLPLYRGRGAPLFSGPSRGGGDPNDGLAGVTDDWGLNKAARPRYMTYHIVR